MSDKCSINFSIHQYGSNTIVAESDIINVESRGTIYGYDVIGSGY